MHTQLLQTLQAIRDETRTSANTAQRVGAALIAMLGATDEGYTVFLRKDQADTAAGRISFQAGLAATDAAIGELSAEAVTSATSFRLPPTLLQGAHTAAALDSPDFNAATHTGFTLQETSTGKWKLTLQAIEVWGKALFNQLEVRQLSYVGGNLVLSAAGSTLKLVQEVRGAGGVTGWKCYIVASDGQTVTANPWQTGDQAKCQRFDVAAASARYYWRLVTSASTEPEPILGADGAELYDGTLFHYIVLSATDCDDGSDAPSEGDQLVQMGSRTDEDRQSLVVLASTAEAAPSLTLYEGICSYSLTAANLTSRLGVLDGIKDDAFPADGQPSGRGLYSQNCYLRGHFHLHTGEDVATRLDIIEGSISSSVEALRQDLADTGGMLQNANFSAGSLYPWLAVTPPPLAAGGQLLMAGGALLSMPLPKDTEASAYARLTTFDGHPCVLLSPDGQLEYPVTKMDSVPPCDAASDGLLQPYTAYLALTYRADTAGSISAAFLGVTKTGYQAFSSAAKKVAVEAAEGDGWQTATIELPWNGTGTHLAITWDPESIKGEAVCLRLRAAVLTTSQTEAVAVRYKTLFEQSAKLLRLSAMNFDADGNPLQTSSLMLKPGSAGITTVDENGKVASIGTFVDGTVKLTGEHIELTADDIHLEGVVTANGGFKIGTDGTMEATGGKFSGTVEATDGKFSGDIVARTVSHAIDTYRLVPGAQDARNYTGPSLVTGKTLEVYVTTLDASLASTYIAQLGRTSVSYDYELHLDLPDPSACPGRVMEIITEDVSQDADHYALLTCTSQEDDGFYSIIQGGHQRQTFISLRSYFHIRLYSTGGHYWTAILF